MKTNWIEMIEKNREEIEQKSEDAFEMAMHDSTGSFHKEFAVIMSQNGNLRIDEYTNSNDEAEDVHFGNAICITSYKYNPDWEDDWRQTEEEAEAVEQETDEEKSKHLSDYIAWYEGESLISEDIDIRIERL